MTRALLAWAPALYAAGYVLGRLRLGHRAAEWAAWNLCTPRWQRRRYRYPSNVVMAVEALWRLLAHPIESRRNWQSWHAKPERVLAPVLDPKWRQNR